MAKLFTIVRDQSLPIADARAEMRELGEPVSMRSVHRFGGDKLEKDAFARWRLKRGVGDKLPRRMKVITADGVEVVDIRGSRIASLNARHANAVKQFISGESDGSDLAGFRGKVIGGRRLETNLDVLESMARYGELDFLELYEEAA